MFGFYFSLWLMERMTINDCHFWVGLIGNSLGFRFEAFDEPWKQKYNEGDRHWEDHWGLMDIARNLKPGLKIPDCGGKRIGS